jgi:hypothetical protein
MTTGLYWQRPVHILFILLLCCFCLLPARLHAWGGEGHRIVALLAQERLTDEAKAQVVELIGPDLLVSVATWADAIRDENTEAWHYVNIPRRAQGYDPDRHCPKEDCVVAQVERFRSILANPANGKEERARALKFLVHFLGDLHQPLHCGDKRDRGGNEIKVTFFEQREREYNGTRYPWNLHAVWDTGLIEHTGLNEQQYAEKLNAWLQSKSMEELQRGTSETWAMECHEAAVKYAYVYPKGRKLGDAYFKKALPVVDESLAKAGVRLARVLNEALRRQGP